MASSTIGASNRPTPEQTPSEESAGTTIERIDQQPTVDHGGEDSPLSAHSPKEFARSKSETVFHDSEAPEASVQHRASSAFSPLTPSLSVDSADMPLPSVEAEDGTATRDHADFVSGTTESQSDHHSIPGSTESASPDPSVGNRQLSLAHGLSDLALSSPSHDRSSVTPNSTNLLTPMGVDREPITVRGLLNATPRPSPAPEGGREKESDREIDVAKFSLSESVTEALTGHSEEMPEAQQQPGLIFTAEDSESEESDLLDDLDRLQIDDQYDVRSVEPLPASPFSNPNFQDSLKRGISLAKSIFSCLDNCELASMQGTQLHRLRQTACRLSLFDYPAKRRIGIVGDSGAGELSPF